MSHLTKESVKKCVSLLREYIDETSLSGKKDIAILALNQLQRITAGTGSEDTTNSDSTTLIQGCTHRPRA